MNAEGIGLEVSPEWLQATATGFLMLLASYWIVALLARVWREVLWREGSDVLEAFAARLGAPIRPSRTGWEVRGAAGCVRVRGGLAGVRTRLTRPDGTKQIVEGWPDPDAAFTWLGSSPLAGDSAAPRE